MTYYAGQVCEVITFQGSRALIRVEGIGCIWIAEDELS